MKRFAVLVVAGVVVLGTLVHSARDGGREEMIRIGLVLPIEHQALSKISAGFQDTIRQHPIGQKVQFKVANGQGDVQLETAQIAQFFAQGYDYLVPVSSGTTSRVLAQLAQHPDRSVLALAARMDGFSYGHLNVTGVEDEITMDAMLTYMSVLVPNLQALAVVYSSSEKIFEEVAALKQTAQQRGIQLQRLMVHGLREVPELLSSIRPENQLIFILKDNLIAHGISMLIPVAHRLGIPLVTSDEGTVIEGADLGIGVSERAIGVEGAKLLLEQIVGGRPLQGVPPLRLEHPMIYVNRRTPTRSPALFEAAQKMGAQFGLDLCQIGAEGDRVVQAK